MRTNGRRLVRLYSRTVIRLAREAKLPGFKVGDQWRFRREAIEHYIREQEQRYIDRQKEEQDTKEEDADKKE